MTPTADVVPPCLEEAGAPPWVLARIPPGWRTIVVYRGSSDGSARTAVNRGATVVREPRRGLGSACHAGLLAAETEFVCLCDCDASHGPALLVGLVDRIATGDTDLVLERGRPAARGAFPPHTRPGNAASARMPRRRTGPHLRDLGPHLCDLGPTRAARRRTLLGLNAEDRRSGCLLETVVPAADAGRRIVEEDMPHRPRRSKATGIWHAVHDMPAVLSAPAQADQNRAGAR
ncbi:glycosyltransferase [Streptomyces sp. Li-HN-5-11]|uniref:glycosyltransferase n=1 Tax=Streptomyces sp. Li-HN-5-11 TaxID=3075432 RepID=UPI0028AF9D34|nr:glycosyltransferase [Streptomyces sp. Li-HN-5-11]WNM30229.1 glycosyltransferase [Streptomyces sp. Li-HN-5-11]